MTSPYLYILVRNTYYYQSKSFCRYGIAIMESNSGAIIKTVSDISCTRSPITDLIKLCNRLHLDPRQLADVIDDFLS